MQDIYLVMKPAIQANPAWPSLCG